MRRIEQDKSGFLERYSTFITVVLLLLVLLLPFLLLRIKLETMAKKELQWVQTENSADLHEELKSFQEDLKPEQNLKRVLQSALREIDCQQALIDPGSQEQTSQDGEKLKHLTKKLINYLRNQGYPQPLFAVAADNDLRHFYYVFSPDFFTAKSFPELAAEFICNYSLKSRENHLPDHLNQKLKDFLKKCSAKDKKLTGYDILQKRILSSYEAKLPSLSMVSRIFSDLYNFQNILFYSEAFQSSSKINGVISIGFLEETIPMQLLLKKALVSPRNPAVRRFATRSDKIFAEKVASAGRLLARNPQGKELLIGVELLPQKLKVSFYQRFISFLSGLLVLSGYAMMVLTCLFQVRLPFSLRQKIMLILALALFIPGILVAIIFTGIAGHADASRADLAQSQLTTSLDQLEMYYQEVINRQVLSNLHFKLKITDLLQQKTPEQLLIDDFSGYLGSNFRRGTIYDREASFFSFLEQERTYALDRLLLTNIVRFLNNIAGLRGNSLARKHLDESAFTDGFAGGLIYTEFFVREVANEAENISSVQNLNPFSRDHYYFFPDLSFSDMRPKAIGFFRVSPHSLFGNYVKSLADYPLRLFNQPGDGYQTNLAIAACTPEAVESEFLYDPSMRKPDHLRSLMYRAGQNQSSGSSAGNESGTLSAWRVFENWPLIFVGSVELQPENFFSFYLQTFPYLLLLFALLVLLLLSEVLSRFFISPLDAVMAGVKSITEDGVLNFKIEINNNDEFDKVGDAFNDMVAGLLQKRHISRFVSSSLINSLDQRGAGENTQIVFMTILASDLRGFTSLSETHPPEVIVSLLNDYFTLMEGEIHRENGLIYRFIGDAIIAVFSGTDNADSALKACRAARQMRQRLAEFNLMQRNLGKLCIDNGVGLASGMVESAVVGQSGGRRDFMFLGEPVDMAEKLEASSKLGAYSKIIIDQTTAELIKEVFSLHPLIVDSDEEFFEIVAEK